MARVTNYMEEDKFKMMMRSFIMSQFSYSPFICMFDDRAINSRINKLMKGLCESYTETLKLLDELLAVDNSVSIHQRNLKLVMTEIYKTQKRLNPSFMEDVFVEKKITYNLRNNNGFTVSRARRDLTYLLVRHLSHQALLASPLKTNCPCIYWAQLSILNFVTANSLDENSKKLRYASHQIFEKNAEVFCQALYSSKIRMFQDQGDIETLLRNLYHGSTYGKRHDGHLNLKNRDGFMRQ